MRAIFGSFLFKGNAMKTIKLTQGKKAMVDDEDYAWLNQWKWYAHKDRNTYYAVRDTSHRTPKREYIRMHRLILGLKKGDGKLSDHWNHNGLDNRKSNLRLCTYSQNAQNRIPLENTASRFKGVDWQKGAKKWCASITNNGKCVHLGLFDSEIQAAKKYDETARGLFGEFAYTNFLKGARE